MGYLNESGLARYDGLIKNWVTLKSGTVDGVDPLLNWQKTETASAVTCYPLPAAPLDPVVTFAFTETGPAEGDKSPTNPSTITGVSSITVTRCETVGVDSTDYVIDLNGTYYGGSVDASAGTMTVTWEGVVFDGSENITQQTTDSDGFYQYNLPVPSYTSTISTNVCTHLLTGGSNRDRCYVRSSGGTGLRIFVSEYSTVEAVKNWLASEYANGNPVTIVYQPATTYTVSLTPLQIYSLSQPAPYTPRLNTVYSDQQSVQVGYPKSPLATSTELTNAIISLGGNV